MYSTRKRNQSPDLNDLQIPKNNGDAAAIRLRGRYEPECHAQGSKAPNRRFRPGYRLDRCGSRCTPSFSFRGGSEIRREEEMGGRV